jgi:hypothetical protein
MQVLNLCLTLVFVVFAYISLGYSYELLYSRLGHTLVWFMVIFWSFRAILQLVFFKLNLVSIAFLLYFLIGAALYAVPIITVT